MPILDPLNIHRTRNNQPATVSQYLQSKFQGICDEEELVARGGSRGASGVIGGKEKKETSTSFLSVRNPTLPKLVKSKKLIT